MKKVLFILCLLAISCICASAQNIVSLKNGSIIKCKVVEMNPGTSIKIETSDGSIYVYDMTEVIKIDTDSSWTPAQTNSNKSSLNSNSSPVMPGAYRLSVNSRSIAPEIFVDGGEVPDDVLQSILGYEYYERYQSARKKSKIGFGLSLPGAILTGAGAGLFLPGIILYGVEVEDLSYTSWTYVSTYLSLVYAGCALMAVGLPMVIAGSVLGKIGTNQAKNIVSEYHGRPYSFNFGPSVFSMPHFDGKGATGAGLQLCFKF